MSDAAASSRDGAKRALGMLSVVVFALAALVRAVAWKKVFLPEGVVFTSPDSYAHIWRIWNAAGQPGSLTSPDPFINFPHGGEVLWSPAFDWTLSILVRVLGLGQPTAEVLCAWIPLLLGACSASLAAVLAARTFSTASGWVAGLLVAVLPASFEYTQIGFLDHHAAVAVVGTLMLGGAMSVVSREGSGEWVWPVAAGATCALALSIWAGALLHIAVLQAAFLFWVVGAAAPDLARSRALRLALAHAVAAVVIAPWSLRTWEIFGDFSPLALTRFQPTYLFAAAICLLAATGVWRIDRLGETRVPRLLSLVAIGGVGLTVAFLTIPDLGAILGRSADWFSGDIEYLANIRELEPLIDLGSSRPWARPVQFLSPLVVLFPIALGVLLIASLRSHRVEHGLLVFWATIFFVFTLAQVRFINTFSIAYAIVLGGAFPIAADAIQRVFENARSMRRVPAVLGLSLALIVGGTAWSFHSSKNASGEAQRYEVRRAARRELARWLGRERPVEFDASGRPAAGLLCSWDAGHDLRYYARWPVHQDPFGPYVSPLNTQLADRYFAATDEEEAIAILSRLKTRYVAADTLGAGKRSYPVESMTGRLVALAGSGRSAGQRPDGTRKWIPALTRHRIVFAVADANMGEWLYEVVPGAVVVGTARPDSEIRVVLKFYDPLGTPRVWETRTRADASGDFRLRLPYSTIGTPQDSAVKILGAYELHSGGKSMSFGIDEAAVRSGSTVHLGAEALRAIRGA